MIPRVGMGPATGWLVVLLIWLLLHLVVGLVATVSRQAATDIVVLGACEVLVLGGAAIILGFTHSPESSNGCRRAVFERAAFCWSWRGSRVVGLAFLLGVALNPIAEALRVVVEAISATPETRLAAKLELLRHETALQTVSLFVVVALVGPWIEELFYRGVLFSRLERRAGPGWAAFVTGAGFVFTHGEVRDWPSLSVVAMVLTGLRYKSGSVIPCFAAHAAFNASTLVLLVGDVEIQHRVSVVIVALVVVAGLLVTIRRTK